jgi:arylsulfatase A-like enzyme
MFAFTVAMSLSARATSPPNVLFIAIDDLNDWVGCLHTHPQVQTPAIDRLAARGALFTNAHCQAPLCNPSRTSVMTGLRPSTTGIYALEPWFRTVPQFQNHVALPQHFRANGYRTLTAGKVYHGAYPPLRDRAAEFDVWGPAASIGATPPHKLVSPTPNGNHPLVDWGTFPHRDEDKGDYQIATWACEQLKVLPRDKPFFLAVGFSLPHVPCYATQKWFDLYPLDSLALPPVKEDDRADLPRFASYMDWILPEPRLGWLREHDQWKPLVRAYLASTSFMDSQVGRLLDALDAAGLAENTIVVLWSDHGFHLGEKGVTGKTTLWERSTHVPLIFAGPDITKDARCGQPVELLDLYPTLIELCALPPRLGLEGHSLLPQLRVVAAPRRDFPAAVTTHGPGNHAVRTEAWRYIRYADGSEELYDEKSDPNEWTNLAANTARAQTIGELRRYLPKADVPPAPGSKSRLIEYRDGRAYWEGQLIDPSAAFPE